VLGHDTLIQASPPICSGAVQASAAGFLELITPSSVTATQKSAIGHDTSLTGPKSDPVRFQVGPFDPGLVDEKMLPKSSKARHRLALKQNTPLRK
jgi:hypothetical protein